MSYAQQAPLESPPAYPMPMAAAPITSPLKDETPRFNPNPTPVPRANIGQEYQEQMFAACARGQHEPITKHGLCGIIAAICLFPIGLLCLCADTERRCARCGIKLY